MSALPLQDVVVLARTRGWPQFKDLSVLTVWDWFIKRPGLLDVDGTRSGRAMCAFPGLFETSILDDELMPLLWSLVGLEALYVEGKTDCFAKCGIRHIFFSALQTPSRRA